MDITSKFLEAGEFYEERIPKKTIFIHHTAGGHRPDWTIDCWNADKNKAGGKLQVGTAYVIGGLSTSPMLNQSKISYDNSYNGKVYQAFMDYNWAHHLGTTSRYNKLLNQQSIGIEICNYGPLTYKNGVYLNYVNKEVPSGMVTTLAFPFRGFTHWHSYTEVQIAALRELLTGLCYQYNIPKFNVWNAKYFEFNEKFLLPSATGILTHTQVRKDKFDCYPHPMLIEMLNNL